MRRILCAVLLLTGVATARADELKLAIGQRGNWDTAVPELGVRAGIFKKYGLDLDLLYTQGGGETQQAVLSRGADIGLAAGTLGVLGAFSKGAPVRILGAEATGAADYWYVPAASAIHKPEDIAGHSIAYSTNGSSTNSIVLALLDQYHIQATPVATGGPPGTFTQVMSGQVDVGWAAPPFGIAQLTAGQIRVVFRGGALPAIRDQTTRLIITHAAVLAQRKDTIDRFMKAYRETIDWMYASPDAIPTYAKFVEVPEPIAQRTRDEFFPREMIDPDRIVGLDAIMADGVKFKFLATPLTPAQLAQVMQIPPR